MKPWWAMAAAVASLMLGGCANGDIAKPVASTTMPTTAAPTPRDQTSALAQWRTRSAPAVASMQDAMRDLGIAMQSADYPAIQANCRKVGEAAAAIGSSLPSPDSTLTAAFDGAVHSFASATASCGIWKSGVAGDQVDAFMTSMHTAIAQMDSAMSMMTSGGR